MRQLGCTMAVYACVRHCCAGLLFLSATAFGAENGLEQISNLSDQQFHEVQLKASRGDRTSEAILAIAYEQGIHVLKNDAEAAKWYRRLAEAGSVEAQNRMGILCQFGRGVPQDYSDAADWFRKAATMGNAAAQSNLAMLYLNGWGVSRDLEQAAKWYEVAARQGDRNAQNNLAYLYSNSEGVAQDKARAAYWYRLAA